MRVARPLWRRFLLPLFVALAVANTIALATWTIPRTLRLRNAAARAETARMEAARERDATGRLRERADAMRANGADLERFYREVTGAAKGNLLPLFEELEEMARAPGLKPGRRGYDRSPVEGAALERVAVTMPLEGTYAQLVGFLRAVERSARFLAVDRISMRGGGEGGGTLQVELSTYLFAAEARTSGRTRSGP